MLQICIKSKSNWRRYLVDLKKPSGSGRQNKSSTHHQPTAFKTAQNRAKTTGNSQHSGRLLGVPGGIESKHRDASADLLKRQQGAFKNLTGKGSSEYFGTSILVSLNLDNTQGHSNYNSKHQYFILK